MEHLVCLAVPVAVNDLSLDPQWTFPGACGGASLLEFSNVHSMGLQWNTSDPVARGDFDPLFLVF